MEDQNNQVKMKLKEIAIISQLDQSKLSLTSMQNNPN